MRSDRVSAFGLLAAGFLTTTATARPDIRARSQQIRRQNDKDCLEDLEDVLDNAPTTSLWPATACDFTSTLSGVELTSNYASFRSRMSSWYSDDLDDITKIESSCTQYVSVFDQIRYCYVTGPFPTVAASTTSSSSVASVASSSASATSSGAASDSSTASRTSTGATGTSTSTSTATPNPDDGGGLDTGARAGLAIGIILAVVLILFICWKFFQRYRSNRMDAAAGPTPNGDAEMHSAAAIGGGAAAAATATAAGAGAGAGAGLAAAAAMKKSNRPENSVYAYKPELSGDSGPMSELDQAAAVAAPRHAGPPRGVAELDPEPPTQLSELPADNYDPTADNFPPPAYVSPMTDAANRNTMVSAISPLSPDSSTAQGQGLGISGQDPSPNMGVNGNTTTDTAVPNGEGETVQHGWGRGWLRRG